MTAMRAAPDPVPRRPEAVTLTELEERLASLPTEHAEKIRASISPAPPAPPPPSGTTPPPPLFTSWTDYLARTTTAERRTWCSMKARRANRERLMSGRPSHRVTTDDVYDVLVDAQGRCVHCGSLAVEKRPSKPNGAPLAWEHVGRRIGSLSHLVARVHGGPNMRGNLGWSCLWCNTWPIERRPGATDRGAVPEA